MLPFCWEVEVEREVAVSNLLQRLQELSDAPFDALQAHEDLHLHAPPESSGCFVLYYAALLATFMAAMAYFAPPNVVDGPWIKQQR